MKSSSKRAARRATLLVALLSVAAVIDSAPALAAGPPTVTATSVTYPEGTHLSLVGSVNPNGALTTYKVEYGIGGFEFSTASVNAGSGTTAVSVKQLVAGLFPANTYQFRLSATNSFGTVTSKIISQGTFAWQEGSGAVFPETFASQGAFELSFPSLNAVISCSESGSGFLGTPNGKSDTYNPSFSGCQLKTYLTGEKLCNVSPFSLKIGGNFTGQAVTVYLPGCAKFYEEIPFSFPDPFVADFVDSKWLVEIPMTWTGQTKIAGHPGTISASSTWALSGVSKGKKFELG